MNKPEAQLREYAFDIRLAASIRVKATSEDAAIDAMWERLKGAACKGGIWEDGSPILFEASMNDDEPQLFEIDWESV